MIPPRPGVNSFPNKVIFASVDDVKTPPNAPPSIGICEPNSFAAFTPTNIDRIENTALPINPIIWAALVVLYASPK